MDGLIGSAQELSTALVSVFVGFILVLDSVPVLGVLIPADVAVLAAVATRGPLGATAVALAVVCGTLAGWSLTFTIGRFLSGPLRRSWLGRRIGPARWERAEDLVARGGGRVVLAAPFLPVFNTIVPIAAGSLRMPYRRFLVYASVGSAMWGAGYVTLGLVAQSVGDAVFGTSNVLTTLLFGLPGVAIGWVTLAQVRRRMGTDRGPAATRDGGRLVASIPAAVPGGAGATVRAPRSSRRASRSAHRPRPVPSIARPVAAGGGVSRPARTPLPVRRRLATWPARVPSAAPAVAATPAPPIAIGGHTPTPRMRPPLLANACTMSLWLALSYASYARMAGLDAPIATPATGTAESAGTRAAPRTPAPRTTAQRLGLPGAVLRTHA
jgi:membrane protein DedA with SNARE-associated domain